MSIQQLADRVELGLRAVADLPSNPFSHGRFSFSRATASTSSVGSDYDATSALLYAASKWRYGSTSAEHVLHLPDTQAQRAATLVRISEHLDTTRDTVQEGEASKPASDHVDEDCSLAPETIACLGGFGVSTPETDADFNHDAMEIDGLQPIDTEVSAAAESYRDRPTHLSTDPALGAKARNDRMVDTKRRYTGFHLTRSAGLCKIIDPHQFECMDIGNNIPATTYSEPNRLDAHRELLSAQLRDIFLKRALVGNETTKAGHGLTVHQGHARLMQVIYEENSKAEALARDVISRMPDNTAVTLGRLANKKWEATDVDDLGH